MSLMMRDYMLYTIGYELKTRMRVYTDMDESHITDDYTIKGYVWRIVAPSEEVALAQFHQRHKYSFIGDEGYARVMSVENEKIDCVVLTFTE